MSPFPGAASASCPHPPTFSGHPCDSPALQRGVSHPLEALGRAARLFAPAPPPRGPAPRCPSRSELLVNGRSLFWELSACQRSGFGAGGEGVGALALREGAPGRTRGLEAKGLGQAPPRGDVSEGEGQGEPSGGIQSRPGPIWQRRGPCRSQSAEGHCQNSALRHPLSCLVSGVRVEIPPSPAKALAQMTQKKKVTWSAQALRSIIAGLPWMGKVSCFPQRWIGPVLMVGSGTQARSYFWSFISMRKERRTDFWQKSSLQFFKLSPCAPLRKRSMVCIIMKLLKRSIPPAHPSDNLSL